MEKSTYIVDAELMALYYKKLFLIEKHLKDNIETNKYGLNLYFHEYIPLLNKSVYPEELRKKLYKLVKVRNKICHMNSLEGEEECLLEYCYKQVAGGS